MKIGLGDPLKNLGNPTSGLNSKWQPKCYRKSIRLSIFPIQCSVGQHFLPK